MIREKHAPEDVEGRFLSVEERFGSLYVWGHDFTPDYSNQYLKALDWLGLADEVTVILSCGFRCELEELTNLSLLFGLLVLLFFSLSSSCICPASLHDARKCSTSGLVNKPLS